MHETLYATAADVEREPGPIVVEIVISDESPLTMEESRDVLYFVRAAAE